MSLPKLGATKQAALEAVKSCWGSPRKVNQSIGVWGKHEQVVFDGLISISRMAS